MENAVFDISGGGWVVLGFIIFVGFVAGLLVGTMMGLGESKGQRKSLLQFLAEMKKWLVDVSIAENKLFDHQKLDLIKRADEYLKELEE